MSSQNFSSHPVVQEINLADGVMLDQVERLAWDKLAITLAIPTVSTKTVTMGGISGVHPISITPESTRFHLVFDQLVTYQTTEERYTRPISEGGDQWCTAYETSLFLKHCSETICTDGWFANQLTHFRIVTYDDVIDLICAGLPEITKLT